MDGAPGFERLVNGAAHAVANIERNGADPPVIAAVPARVDFNQWNTEWNPVRRRGSLHRQMLIHLPLVSSSVLPIG